MTVAATVMLGIAAVAAWPHMLDRSVASAEAAAFPTMAPVTPDYLQRGKLVAFWERATNEHHRGDMISPNNLAEQYLQRYREHFDVGDLTRADHAAHESLAAQPMGNLGAEFALAAVELTEHRFHAALSRVKSIERWDAGDDNVIIREAGLELEIGDTAAARRALDRVARKNRSDAWNVVQSHDLAITGHLAQARELFVSPTAYANAEFDAPAQSRAWYYVHTGEMAFDAGDIAAAEAAETQALAIYPDDADAQRVRARIECGHAEWRACLSDAIASSARVPYPETLGFIVDARRALGDEAGARAAHDEIRVIERLGDSTHIADRLLAMYDADHHVDTGEAYRLALTDRAARDDVYAEDTLAWAAASDGRWQVARRAIARAQASGIQNAGVAYHAGVIAQHDGDLARAGADFRIALAQNSSFNAAQAADARTRLAALVQHSVSLHEEQK
jgi:tetratricopeptide (TPR) repeat protein